DLVALNPVFLGPWMDALRPVRSRLVAPLGAIYRDGSRPRTERSLAANLLADEAGDDPALLADLLLAAEGDQFAALFPKVLEQGTLVLSAVETALAKEPPPDATDAVRDRLAQRRARAAVALVRLGRSDGAWRLLGQNADPSARSYFINWLGPLGAAPQ